MTNGRLLFQQNISITYQSHTDNTIVFKVSNQQTLINAGLTMVFSNAIMLAIVNRQNVPMQARNISTVIGYYQWYPEDRTNLGFHYIGQIISGLVWTVAVGFMAVGRLT